MKTQVRNSTLMTAAANQASHLMEAGTDAYNAAAKQTRAFGKNVDRYVRENPWMAIGAACGVGLLLGFMCRRK